MKRRALSKKMIALITAGTVALFVGVAAAALAVTGGFEKLGLGSPGEVKQADVAAEGTTQPPLTLPDDDESNAALVRPEKMNGAWLTAGTDYYKDQNASFQQAASEADKALESMVIYKMNTVIIPTQLGSTPLYAKASSGSPAFDASQGDLFAYVVNKAKEKGLYVYASIPLLTGIDGPLDPFSPEDMEKILQKVTDVCKNYDLDGVFFDDYYYKDGTADYNLYMKNGGGVGYEQYKKDRLTEVIRQAAYTVRKAKGTLYTGLIADPVWAKEAEGGMETTAKISAALSELSADTLGWAKGKLVHCVLVKDFRSTMDEELSFETVAQWWSDQLKDTECDLYIGHAADAVKAKKEGFKSPDQLTKQMMQLKNISQRGSAFYTISALTEDQSGSTSALIQYMAGEIEDDLVLKELTLTSPSKLTFTTYDNSFRLTGASDPTFPLKLNGKDMERTELGYFSQQMHLNVGTNTFTLTHKEKTITIKATYKVVVIREVSPVGTQRLEGSTQFSVSAICLQGSTAKATFMGKTIALSPTAISNDTDVSSDGTGYAIYTGSFTLPAATASEQTVGPVKFSVTYKGQTETKTGAKFTIPAKAEETTVSEGSSQGGSSDKVLDTTGTVSSGKRKIAQVIVYQAETFNGNTVDDFSRPVNSYLPMGTLDYAADRDIVNYSGSSVLRYRKLDYGKRVYVHTDGKGDNIKILTGSLPSTNSVTASDVSSSGRYTTVTIDTHWKAPFDFTLSPQNYNNPNATNPRPDYGVSSFTAKYVDITFAYAVSGQGVLDFSKDPLFSKAEWLQSKNSTTGISQYTLRLHLRKAGGFYGWSANYNDEGQLIFQFLHPAKITAANNSYGYSLSGVKIMIDPGHGGADPGALGPIPSYSEAKLNMGLALKLKEELESIGAQVKLTFTSGSFSLDQRVRAAKSFQPDVFVSIHRNSSTSDSAKGYENYYFYSFSQPLAKAVYNRTAQNFSNKRGSKFYPFYVTRFTDCPSILTENGFVSNKDEFSSLIKDEYDRKLAKSTAAGIVDYFKGIQ